MELLFYMGILLFVLAFSFGMMLLFFWLRLREEKKLFLEKRQFEQMGAIAYETLFEMTSEPAIVVDDKKTIVGANPAALRTFPSLVEAVGKLVKELNEPVLHQVLIEQNYNLISLSDRLYRPISTPLYQRQERIGELVCLMDMSGVRDEKRLRILREQIQDIVFEWDLVNGRLSYSQAYERQFGYSITGLASEETHRNHYVHPDDLERLCAVQQDVRAGMPFAELEYRVRKVKNDVSGYAWVYVRAKSVLDMTGRTIAVIGTMVDIDDKKKQAELQNAWLQYDALTGVLNLESMRRQIECRQQSIPPHAQCQVFLLDVDRFRELDRLHGHHNADLILKETAGRIHSFFSSRDIVGRMAGDRFLVFRELLLGVEDEDQLEQWLQTLQKAINNPILLPDQIVRITCCIGIALYPKHGATVDLLIDNADKAVYLAKQKGGNCTAFYEQPKV